MSGLCLHITGNRFTSPRTRDGCCVSITTRGSHLARTGTTTRGLYDDCGCSDAVVSAVVYLSNARIMNAYLTSRLAGGDFMGVGTRRAVCIMAPRFAGNSRLLFESGVVPVIGGGRILVLTISITANAAMLGTVRTVGCCNNRAINVTSVFSAGRRYNKCGMGSMFGPTSLPSCFSIPTASYPLYGRGGGLSTLVGDRNFSGLWDGWFGQKFLGVLTFFRVLCRGGTSISAV